MRWNQLVLISSLALCSCRHASLMTSDPDSTSLEAGRSLIESWKARQPHCPGELEIKGKDFWNSTVYRWFTPLDKQETAFTLKLRPDRTELQLGNSQTLIQNKGRLFKRIGTREIADSSSLRLIYLESLRLYAELPQRLAKAENAAFLGRQSQGEKSYEVLFFNLEAGPWNDPKKDQYLAYFSVEAHELEWIQFTYRDLTSTYVGWIRFGKSQNFDGFSYPESMSIMDSWDATEAIHRISLDQLSCTPTSAELLKKGSHN